MDFKDIITILKNKYTVLIISLIIISVTTYDGINKTNSENPEQENITLNVITVFISLIVGLGYYSYKTFQSSYETFQSVYKVTLGGLIFIVITILIYLYAIVDIKTFATFSYLSSIILALIGIVGLSILFYMSSNWLKSLAGWKGFIVNFIFYIPCLLTSFVYYLINEFKLTTSPILILFFIELFLLLSYLYIPDLVNYISNKDGVLLHNTHTLDNGDIEIQDTFFLNTQNTFSLDEQVMPDMDFQIHGNRNKTTFQNYAISMWTYVNAHGSNKLAYNTESLIFDYGNNKPKVTYYNVDNDTNVDDNTSRDTYRIYFTNNKNSTDQYYEMTLPLQRWNNLVFNFSSTHADLFVNGNLERTFSFADGKMPDFEETDIITTGKTDGLHGAISNVRYYTKTLSKHKITNMYNIFMKKTPPTFNM